MTTPSRVRACADRLASAGGALGERIDRVDVRGTADAALLTELREAARLWHEEGFGDLVALDALGDEVNLMTSTEVDGELRLIITKRPTVSTFYFLTAGGVIGLLSDSERSANARRVLVAESFDKFQTVSCMFEPWKAIVADETEPNRLHDIVPRRIVRDQIAQVPLSVGPILLTTAPAQTSAVFEAWQQIATRQLLMTLCDEVWKDDNVTRVSLSGPRKRRLTGGFDNTLPDRDLGPATDAVSWVYDSGRDVETRHTLFIYELAREWPGETPFVEEFATRAPSALEAAKSAFRMHVRESSKDTLKALQDLRKNLADDVARVVAQTRELVSTTWRDFLVAVTALFGRIALVSSSKPSAPLATEWLLIGAAIFLAFSIITTVLSNASFMSIDDTSRKAWKTKLYGFLDDADFNILATDPLSAAKRTYRCTRATVCVAYVVLIGVLVYVARQPDVSTDSLQQNGHDLVPASMASPTAGATLNKPNATLKPVSKQDVTHH